MGKRTDIGGGTDRQEASCLESTADVFRAGLWSDCRYAQLPLLRMRESPEQHALLHATGSDRLHALPLACAVPQAAAMQISLEGAPEDAKAGADLRR